MRTLLFAVLLAACQTPMPESSPDSDVLGLIPAPLQVERQSGSVEVGPHWSVAWIHAEDPKGHAARFVETTLAPWFASVVGVSEAKRDGLLLTAVVDDTWPVDAAGSYQLQVAEDGITLRAGGDEGLFYAMQTLRQLFPAEAERSADGPRRYRLPCVTIRDQPRFAWRGMHLDVSRHFFAVAEVKRFLDVMALHKFNVFHWHLTDDQGWRIEIKKWPKLTSVGAWRRESPLPGDRDRGDGTRYGGFYTHAEIREVVEHARRNHITVVPEIEMPGHAQAAIAAYPWLGNSDVPLQVRTSWGVSDHVYDVEEKTFAFLQDVLSEVVDLFPGVFVHIGGDECPKKEWKASASAQQRMREEGLKDEHELQSWFIRRIQRFLQSKGKRLIGWDEIQEGGLAKGAAMMVWRDAKYAIAAVRAGNDVVMTPTSHCYFDYYQGDPKTEPEAIGGRLELATVYEFEPMPQGLSPAEQARVLGVQANLWTEYIRDFGHLMYMAYPRGCAMAENGWTAPGRKDWAGFERRLQVHRQRLTALQKR